MSTRQNNRTSTASVPVLEMVVLLVAYVALLMLGKYFLGTEFAAVMKWWGALVVLIVTVLYLLIRGVVSFKDAMSCVPK